MSCETGIQGQQTTNRWTMARNTLPPKQILWWKQKIQKKLN